MKKKQIALASLGLSLLWGQAAALANPVDDPLGELIQGHKVRVEQTQSADNPFDDVPKDHWAYDSIKVLADEGIIDGYEDGSFQGDKELTREEMAALVGRAHSNIKKQQSQMSPQGKEALDKLDKEYYQELKAIGMRLKALEKYSSKVVMSGDVRLRYIANVKNQANDRNQRSSQFEHRVRLGYKAYINPALEFTGRMNFGSSARTIYDGMGEDTNSSDYDGNMYFDLGYLTWHRGKYTVDMGRMELKLGLGVVAGGTQDGIYVKYKPDDKWDLAAGIADMAYQINPTVNDSSWLGRSVPIVQASAGVSLGDSYMTLSHLRTLYKDQVAENKYYAPEYEGGGWLNYRVPYNLDQWAIGIKTPIDKKWTLSAEAVTNLAGNIQSSHYYDESGNVIHGQGYDKSVHRNGFWAGLSYGHLDINTANSFQFDAVYVSMGNWAIDSTYYGHGLWTNGGNGLGRDGSRGVGLQMQYMLAKNACLSGDIFFVRPYDEAAANFSRYSNPWQVALNYFF